MKFASLKVITSNSSSYWGDTGGGASVVSHSPCSEEDKRSAVSVSRWRSNRREGFRSRKTAAESDGWGMRWGPARRHSLQQIHLRYPQVLMPLRLGGSGTSTAGNAGESSFSVKKSLPRPPKQTTHRSRVSLGTRKRPQG